MAWLHRDVGNPTAFMGGNHPRHEEGKRQHHGFSAITGREIIRLEPEARTMNPEPRVHDHDPLDLDLIIRGSRAKAPSLDRKVSP